MQALLSFEQAPPLNAPLRFFLTAPLFGVIAGLLLLLEGEGVLLSRWSPSALALTHLLTLGFMLQIMIGALIQVLPVVAGANLKHPRFLAQLVHATLSLGALLLAAGFVFAINPALHAGAALLVFSVGFFLLSAIRALHGVPSSSPTIRGIKLALFGLFGTVLLGVFLLVALRQGTTFSLVALTELHAGWGLGAWSAVLLAAVAYVVVPMFQLTPGYPARPAWWFSIGMTGLLVLWSLAVWLDVDLLIRLAKGLLALSGMAFCALTLRLQSRRRRAKSDATSRYWKLGMISTFLALSMMLTAAISPALGGLEAWSFCFAVLLIAGGIFSFMIGMLYKIVPFLAWLHLQYLGKGQVTAPTMNKLLPDSAMQRQFYAHQCGIVLLFLAAVFPEWGARLAGLGLMLSLLWLEFNLLAVVRRYRNFASEIAGSLVPG